MASLFVDILRSRMRAREILIHEFVVMPDHVHILLTVPGDTSLEKVMQLIKGRYSFEAGRMLGFKGEIWQRGFSDVRIKDQSSFEGHRKYIASNPVRAGLVSSPEEYPYGSLYLKARKRAGANAHDQASASGTTEVVP
jgi:putative transposase